MCGRMGAPPAAGTSLVLCPVWGGGSCVGLSAPPLTVEGAEGAEGAEGTERRRESPAGQRPGSEELCTQLLSVQEGGPLWRARESSASPGVPS